MIQRINFCRPPSSDRHRYREVSVGRLGVFRRLIVSLGSDGSSPKSSGACPKIYEPELFAEGDPISAQPGFLVFEDPLVRSFLAAAGGKDSEEDFVPQRFGHAPVRRPSEGPSSPLSCPIVSPAPDQSDLDRIPSTKNLRSLLESPPRSPRKAGRGTFLPVVVNFQSGGSTSSTSAPFPEQDLLVPTSPSVAKTFRDMVSQRRRQGGNTLHGGGNRLHGVPSGKNLWAVGDDNLSSPSDLRSDEGGGGPIDVWPVGVLNVWDDLDPAAVEKKLRNVASVAERNAAFNRVVLGGGANTTGGARGRSRNKNAPASDSEEDEEHRVGSRRRPEIWRESPEGVGVDPKSREENPKQDTNAAGTSCVDAEEPAESLLGMRSLSPRGGATTLPSVLDIHSRTRLCPLLPPWLQDGAPKWRKSDETFLNPTNSCAARISRLFSPHLVPFLLDPDSHSIAIYWRIAERYCQNVDVLFEQHLGAGCFGVGGEALEEKTPFEMESLRKKLAAALRASQKRFFEYCRRGIPLSQLAPLPEDWLRNIVVLLCHRGGEAERAVQVLVESVGAGAEAPAAQQSEGVMWYEDHDRPVAAGGASGAPRSPKSEGAGLRFFRRRKRRKKRSPPEISSEHSFSQYDLHDHPSAVVVNAGWVLSEQDSTTPDWTRAQPLPPDVTDATLRDLGQELGRCYVEGSQLAVCNYIFSEAVFRRKFLLERGVEVAFGSRGLADLMSFPGLMSRLDRALCASLDLDLAAGDEVYQEGTRTGTSSDAVSPTERTAAPAGTSAMDVLLGTTRTITTPAQSQRRGGLYRPLPFEVEGAEAFRSTFFQRDRKSTAVFITKTIDVLEKAAASHGSWYSDGFAEESMCDLPNPSIVPKNGKTSSKGALFEAEDVDTFCGRQEQRTAKIHKHLFALWQKETIGAGSFLQWRGLARRTVDQFRDFLAKFRMDSVDVVLPAFLDEIEADSVALTEAGDAFLRLKLVGAGATTTQTTSAVAVEQQQETTAHGTTKGAPVPTAARVARFEPSLVTVRSRFSNFFKNFITLEFPATVLAEGGCSSTAGASTTGGAGATSSSEAEASTLLEQARARRLFGLSQRRKGKKGAKNGCGGGQTATEGCIAPRYNPPLQFADDVVSSPKKLAASGPWSLGNELDMTSAENDIQKILDDNLDNVAKVLSLYDEFSFLLHEKDRLQRDFCTKPSPGAVHLAGEQTKSHGVHFGASSSEAETRSLGGARSQHMGKAAQSISPSKSTSGFRLSTFGGGNQHQVRTPTPRRGLVFRIKILGGESESSSSDKYFIKFTQWSASSIIYHV